MNHTANASPAPAHGAMDYIVVVSNEEDHHAGYHHFAEKVNRKLKAGYQLHGQPFCVNQVLCQAMVRTGDKLPSGETTVFFKHPAGYHG
jgi:hypothetical protein